MSTETQPKCGDCCKPPQINPVPDLCDEHFPNWWLWFREKIDRRASEQGEAYCAESCKGACQEEFMGRKVCRHLKSFLDPLSARISAAEALKGEVH